MRHNAFHLVVILLLLPTIAQSANSPISQKDQKIYESAQRSENSVLANLKQLVNIDSGSGDQEGLETIGNIMADKLKALGGEIKLFPAAPNAGNIIVATFKGNGKSRILLLGHMDTVFKKGTVAQRPFKIKGGRAHGPGVSDEKGGIVLGLQAISILKEMEFKEFGTITFLLNPDEEIGSQGSQDIIRKLAKKHDVVFCLEPGIPGDAIMNWRAGNGRYTIEDKGRAAHAGVEPEKGRNAAMELAHQMLQLGNLGDLAKHTTVNFTIISAGERLNIIPDKATATADVRALEVNEFKRVEKQFREISQQHLIPGTEVSIKTIIHHTPFSPNRATDALAAKAQDIYQELGLSLKIQGSGGASDANSAAAEGVATIDGLGIVGGNDHTPEEYIEIESIIPRLYLLTRLIMETSRSIK